jgi:diguanylate cyclase (GGDEF)-like protein
LKFNRALFYDRLEMKLRQSDRTGEELALLFIDIDRFKEVNDTLGHHVGDALLIQAAQRIRECVRDYDTVARLGGDEFTVILAAQHKSFDTGTIAQKIIDRLSVPFMLGEGEVYVSASIGIALYPADANDVNELIKNADQAMYVAKNGGRKRFCFFTKDMQESALERMRLVADLRMAVAEQQFEVYYQPIVNLQTGRVHKAEALVRWQHPQRGLVSPGKFISVAEEVGVIHDIGDWVFMQAAAQARVWRETRHPDFQISINKSPVQFEGERRGHASWIDRLRELGLSGNSIVIEITEGILMNNSASVTESLIQFRDAGIQVAIDDFGTGYSSLAYLNKFDIDYLKIDQSFVRNLAPDSSDRALCEAIVGMAHSLGLLVIAEGVETAQQRDLLKDLHCDFAQGYLYSKPVPASQFEAYLDSIA